jgi:hypothetical protein
MTDTLLYAATAAIPVIALVGVAVHLWRWAHPLNITVTEWRERMKRLEPLAEPKFRTKQLSKGAAGVCFPEPKVTKMTVVKRKASK